VARYSVRIKTSAIKELEAVAPKKERQRLAGRISALGREPRPKGCQKLAGEGERYRVRQGRYRIVYSVNDGEQVVEVVKVGHRKEVYR
jgi:mRNA interferase RelE/StbE